MFKFTYLFTYLLILPPLLLLQLFVIRQKQLIDLRSLWSDKPTAYLTANELEYMLLMLSQFTPLTIVLIIRIIPYVQLKAECWSSGGVTGINYLNVHVFCCLYTVTRWERADSVDEHQSRWHEHTSRAAASCRRSDASTLQLLEIQRRLFLYIQGGPKNRTIFECW